MGKCFNVIFFVRSIIKNEIFLYCDFRYLEKQDFLERADMRQFELEKAMRAANRSQRN